MVYFFGCRRKHGNFDEQVDIKIIIPFLDINLTTMNDILLA